MMTFDDVSSTLGVLGTIAFAITGVLAVAERRVDFFSAIVLGVITAVGGGTIRDLILDVPVFWSLDLSYIRIAVLASIITFVALSFMRHAPIFKTILLADALGISLFGVGGAFKAYELGFAWPIGPLILGVITAIGGGAIRDVLTGRKTLLMSDEVYAVPVVIGCLCLLIILNFSPEYPTMALITGTVVAFTLRTAAVVWELRLPNWFTTQIK
jgi:uncharacterized membrane protein YeiH